MSTYPRVITTSTSDRAAVGCAKLVGLASRVVGQRGLGTAYRLLGHAPALGRAECVVEIEAGTFFETDVFEPAWGPTVLGGRPYEPEVEHVLRRCAAYAPTLVDCGANYGYWSVRTTAPSFGFRLAVAIEASKGTAARLRRNADRNDGRIHAIHAAVSDVSGRTVLLEEGEGHIRAHVKSDGASGGTPVRTITVDDAVREAGAWEHETFVLKLDVEGLELQAYAGAAALRAAREHAIVVEDFADNDGFGNVRAFVKDGYEAYYVTPGGRWTKVTSTDDAVAAVASEPRPGNARNFACARTGSKLARDFAAAVGRP